MTNNRSVTAASFGEIRPIAALAAILLVALAGLVVVASDASAHSPHDTIHDIAISPNFENDGVVYTISRTLFLKSTDGGTTWTELQSLIPSNSSLLSVGVSAINPDLVYVGGFDGLFMSTDGADSFTRVDEMKSFDVIDVVMAPWDDEVVVTAGRDGNPRLHTPASEEWAAISGFRGATTVAFADDTEGVIFVGDDAGTLLATDDTGATWVPITVDVDKPAALLSVAVSPSYSDDGTVFVSTDAGVYRSDDRGATFSAVTEGLADPQPVAVALSPTFATDNTLWVSTFSDGVYMSDDRGESWVFRGDGLTKNPQADQLGVSHFYEIVAANRSDADGKTLFLGGFDGLFTTADGGVNWTPLETQSASTIMGVALSPTFADDRTLLLTTYLNGTLRSSDGGNEWKAVNHGLASGFWTLSPIYVNRLFSAEFSPNFSEDQLAFVVGRGVIYRSDDGGTEWDPVIPEGAIQQGESPPDFFFLGLSPDFVNDQTILVGTDRGKVFLSVDAGASYTRLPDLGVTVTSLVLSPDFATDRTAFAGTPEGVYETNDGGTSWQRGDWPDSGAQAETSLAISPAFGDDETIFAGTRAGLLSSVDGGTTWAYVGASTPIATGVIEAVAVSPDFENDQTILTSVLGQGLFRSSDGGESWTPVGPALIDDALVFSTFYFATSEPIMFSPSFATDRTVFGFDGTSLMRSVDAGETWTLLAHPTTEHDTSAESAPGEIFTTPRYEDDQTEDDQSITDEALDGTEASASGTTPSGEDGAPAARSSGRADPDLTASKLIFAAAAALLSLLVLALAERTPARWRWIMRVAAAVAVFVGILWLLMRR